MLSADTERVLALILLRQTEYAKNDLMTEAEELVNTHFKQINNSNILKPAQLKNLEGVAFTALRKADVPNFIRKQANKEDTDKPEKKKWTHNDLHKRLPAAIDAVVAKETNLARDLTQEAQQAQIDPDSVTAWFTKERKAEVEINTVRAFITYFATYYVTKAKEFGVTEEGEER